MSAGLPHPDELPHAERLLMERARLLVPIRDFSGLTRLSQAITVAERRSLSRHLAERMIHAGTAAGLQVTVVTSDAEVAEWTDECGAETWPDGGGGLSEALRLAVDQVGTGRWIVAHADLPRVTAESLIDIVDHSATSTVLVPSLDGGTNVIAGNGPFRFSFGPGSFHRHLSYEPTANVRPSAALSIEIDTPKQLALLRPSLSPSLGFS